MNIQRPNLFLGCITGTSVDGLDIALIRIADSQSIAIERAETVPLPDKLRKTLLELGQPGADDLDQTGYCDIELGHFIGEAINSLLHRWGLKPTDIAAIGSHGQTIRHRPPTANRPYGFSTQIGDPNQIAERSKLTTVADFRRRDRAAGGHGAPLAPPFHQALFGHLSGTTVVLNIGGISNISILGKTPSGFDTGPGNALMDSWCERHIGTPYDQSGKWAAAGKIDESLLAACLSDSYFQLTPPKSTGREYFNLTWLNQYSKLSTTSPVDVQATLCALTVTSVLNAVHQQAPGIRQLIVCGGGRLNNHLMSSLAQRSDFTVGPSEDWNIDGDAIEAALFAWLAHCRLAALASNEPAVSGAQGYRILGAVYAS